MELKYESTRTWLETEFARRRQKNSRYSLRMFARQLTVPSGRLSELVSGRRRMSEELGARIATRLLLPPEERDLFLQLARQERSPKTAAKETVFRPLDSDAFHAIADWYHFAILSLMETDDYTHDPAWIAKRLNISPIQARGALERLERLELIREKANGRWEPMQEGVTTTHDLESVALRISHRQTIAQTLEALDTVPLEQRDVTSMTMAIDRKRLPRAKQMIKKFRRELSTFLESGDCKDEVYNINIQLVPLTVSTNGEKK
jgi:uncharacterized protein (TIGR02147 family)